MQGAVTLVKNKTGKIELSVRGRKIYFTRKCRTNYEAEVGYAKLKKQLAEDGWRIVQRFRVEKRVRKAQEEVPPRTKIMHRYARDGTVGGEK